METLANHGGSWTDAEETILLKRLSTTETIEHIAQAHSRTVGAIRARQNHLARQMIMKQGITIEEAARRVRTHPSSVQQSMDALKKTLTNARERSPPVVKQEETMLSVMVDIRELMRQMVANQVKIMASFD
jgi:uncharacterized protein (DUF885 family)